MDVLLKPVFNRERVLVFSAHTCRIFINENTFKRCGKMLPVINYLTFQDGQIIFEEGSTDDSLYVVDCGAVELSKWLKE